MNLHLFWTQDVLRGEYMPNVSIVYCLLVDCVECHGVTVHTAYMP